MNWHPEALWLFYQHNGVDSRTMQPAVAVSPWTVQKAANRLARTIEKVESRRWLPKVLFQLTGLAKRELAAANTLLREAGQLIKESR